MLGAVARLAEERPRGMPTIIMACTVNEEHGYSGATALTKLWSQAGSIIPRQPDVAVVAEPTELQVVVAHKGVVRWRCHAHGRATHSSQPQLGVNAIFKMSRVLAALERYQLEVTSQLGEHPLCGRPTLSVGTIAGGLSVNTVPDLCTIEIDRRLIPGEKTEAAYRQVLDFVASEIGNDPAIEHEPPFLIGFGLSDEANGPLADRMAASRPRGEDRLRKSGRALWHRMPPRSPRPACHRSCSGPARSIRPTRPTNGWRWTNSSRPAKRSINSAVAGCSRRRDVASRLPGWPRQLVVWVPKGQEGPMHWHLPRKRLVASRHRQPIVGATQITGPLERIQNEVMPAVIQRAFGIHVVPLLVVDRHTHFWRIAVIQGRRSSGSTRSTRSFAGNRRTDSGTSGSSRGCCMNGPIGDHRPAGLAHGRPTVARPNPRRSKAPAWFGGSSRFPPYVMQEPTGVWRGHTGSRNSGCLGLRTGSARVTDGIEGISVRTVTDSKPPQRPAVAAVERE